MDDHIVNKNLHIVWGCLDQQNVKKLWKLAKKTYSLKSTNTDMGQCIIDMCIVGLPNLKFHAYFANKSAITHFLSN